MLTDVTGNTHRAEICIDKLYSPDGPTGRLGLVEFRGFEMPPDPRMSLAQQLLIRALLARLWHSAGQWPLTRWGTVLHDRFMLPHFVWTDFLDVLRDLPITASTSGRNGSRRRPSSVSRSAARSSMKASTWNCARRWSPGMCWARPAPSAAPCATPTARPSGCRSSSRPPTRTATFTCNGRQGALQPTGDQRRFRGGVRFKAWQPGMALHPVLPVDAPLTFDIFDTWTGRALGGCVYHVAHPGGRNYETFPVNGNEAEARRLARFEPNGHTPGALCAPPEAPHPEFPMTLDLRRSPGRLSTMISMQGLNQRRISPFRTPAIRLQPP
jgi:uncharacterized protein (DUF2126 family)